MIVLQIKVQITECNKISNTAISVDTHIDWEVSDMWKILKRFESFVQKQGFAIQYTKLLPCLNFLNQYKGQINNINNLFLINKEIICLVSLTSSLSLSSLDISSPSDSGPSELCNKSKQKINVMLSWSKRYNIKHFHHCLESFTLYSQGKPQ